MSKTFGGASWQVALPKDWLGRHHTECATMESDARIGALQVSSHRKKGGEVSDDDLNGFAAEHVDAGAKLRPIQLGDFSGYHLHFGTDGAYWRHWYLRHGPVALFVTYNCAPENRGVEDEEVAAILESLKAI
jgi:hypothetical protein